MYFFRTTGSRITSACPWRVWPRRWVTWRWHLVMMMLREVWWAGHLVWHSCLLALMRKVLSSSTWTHQAHSCSMKPRPLARAQKEHSKHCRRHTIRWGGTGENNTAASCINETNASKLEHMNLLRCFYSKFYIVMFIWCAAIYSHYIVFHVWCD